MANEFVVKNGLISKGSAVVTGTLDVSSSITGSNLVLNGNQISGSAGGNITLRTSGDVTIAGGLNISNGPLQFGGSGGSAGQVLTSAGTSAPPTWSTSTGISALTGDVIATGPGSATSTVQGMGGASSTVHYVIEGGKYATLQAAVDAATADDVILVGPKTTGNWGNTTLYGNKNLLIGALGGSHANKVVEVGSITYAVDTSGSLNVNENEVFINGLYIQGSFADACVVLSGSSRPGRLRLMGCYIDNTSTSGSAAVKNVNTPTFSSLYVDNCVVSISNNTSGIAVYHSGAYTTVRNRADVTGGQYALTAVTGTVEIFESLLSVNKSNAAIDVSGPGTYVAVGYSTIQNVNTANSALASGVAVGAGSIFGIGDATISVGSVVPPGISSGSVATGLGTFLYGALTFSYVTTISTAVASPAYQAGGVFTQGIGVGLLSQFSVAPTGNVTGSNMLLNNNLRISGNQISGSAGGNITLGTGGNITVAGDVAVAGGDITTTASTFTLANTTATTLNMGGAATTITAGASGGSTTFNGNVTGSNFAVNGGNITTTQTTANIFNTTATTVNFAGAASTALRIGNSAGANTVSGSTRFLQGLSGSLTKLVDGTSYLIAGGGGLLITTGSTGAVTITGGGGVSPYNSYTTTAGSPFTLAIPTNCNFIEMEVCGGGGGGGSGRIESPANSVFGGGGGSGGSRTYYSVKADTIRTLSSSLIVTIGAGGAGGAARTGPNDGLVGSSGSATFITCGGSTIIYASGGLGGGAGTNAGGIGASVVRWRDSVSDASGSSSSITTTPQKPFGAPFAGPGGAGGGITAAGAVVLGGAGGRGGDFFSDATDRSGVGGSSAGVSGGAASAGTHSPTGGGGGGGGAGHSAGNGGTGGAGVQGSGGGGGGGAVYDAGVPGRTSGAGGAGGAGWAVVRFT